MIHIVDIAFQWLFLDWKIYKCIL